MKRRILFVMVLGLFSFGAVAFAETKLADLEPTPPVKKVAEVKALPVKPVKKENVVKAAAKLPEKKKGEKIVEKTGTGTVVFIRSNKMAVQFVSGEAPLEEMYLPFNKGIKFNKVTGYSGMGYGDQVKVKYQETVTPAAKEGEPPMVGNRMAVEVTLLKSVQPKKPKVEGVLESKELGSA